jgi:3'(2'), 5'-bisphosphate nucleotidase
VVSRLSREFPNDSIVAEEDTATLRVAHASSLRNSVVERVRHSLPDADAVQVLSWIDRGSGTCGPRYWTLDPIDGTKGLVRGGQYAIALALMVNARVQIAAVGCPRLTMTTTGPTSLDVSAHAVIKPVENGPDGGVAVAVRGHGAWWMPLFGVGLTRLSVSQETDPAQARVLHSYESRHSDVEHVRVVLQRLGSHTSPILIDSQVKHVLVAAGVAELLLRFPVDSGYHEAIWDETAGSLLIEEAGGRVTDIDGRPLDFTTGRRLVRNHGLVASNGTLHDAVLDIVRQRTVG